MAFSARGREESQCVHVWLGKSEVTALTHSYISPYAHLRTPQRGGEGRSQTEKWKRETSHILFKGLQLILHDEKNKSEYAFVLILFFSLLFKIIMILIND